MSEKTISQENKMGVMPVNRLLLTMAAPMVISMLVQAMYNIVDSVFVSYYSQDGLTAVSLSFPVQNLMIAVSVGTAVGVNALLSRKLGEKKSKDASRAAVNGLFLAVVSYAVFAIFGLFFAEVYFTSQTTDSAVVEMGTNYLSICTIFSFGVFLQVMLERLMQSTGKTFFNMITQGLGAVTNIIMDPLLIFGIGIFPEMGVAGAAAATVIGQILAMFLSLYFNIAKNKEISLSLKGFRPHGTTIRTIYSVGIPSIVMQSIGSVMTYGMNAILLSFSKVAVSIFGIYFKLQSFIFMPVFGLNNAMVPIIAYNYGAKKKERITHTIRSSIITAVCIMLIGFALFQLIPEVMLGFFNADASMLAMGANALRTISISFLFAGFCIVAGSVFQALGNGILSMLVSLARQLFVILPAAYLLGKFLGLDAVWWAFPIAELVSLSLSVLFLIRVYRKEIRPLAE